MDIYDYLKKDHEKVDKLFKQITDSLSFEQQKEIFELIEKELTLHAESEENIFYKALENHNESRKQALHGEKEHSDIKRLIKEINQLSTNPDWQDKVMELKELVKHHVKEEEGEMFSVAKKIFSEEKAIELKEKVHDYKEKMLEQLT